MTGVLVDTNVLLDLATDDEAWAAWSIQKLEENVLRGPLLINDVIYAEVSVRFTTIEALDLFLADGGFTHAQAPRAALFLAAKAYQRYRVAGGVRTGVLPDFFIGAHASVEGLPLLTRDPGRYRTYFPKIELITPA